MQSIFVIIHFRLFVLLTVTCESNSLSTAMVESMTTTKSPPTTTRSTTTATTTTTSRPTTTHDRGKHLKLMSIDINIDVT